MPPLWPVRRRCGVRGGGFAGQRGLPGLFPCAGDDRSDPVIASLRRFSKHRTSLERKVFQSTGHRRHRDCQWPSCRPRARRLRAESFRAAFRTRNRARSAIGLSGAGLDDELLLVPNEQLVFPAVVKPGLARELAVVIEHGVQRHVRIGNVVADDGREKTDVALRVRPVLVQRLEAADEPARDFVRAPRHAGRSA